MRPSHRPHYAFCPYVCLSVCLSVCPIWGRNSKTKSRKIKIAINVPQWNASSQLKRSKGHGHRTSKPQQSGVVFINGRQINRWRPDGKIGLTVVSPNLQSAPEPETLGNWTDAAAYYVGTTFGGDIFSCWIYVNVLLCVIFFGSWMIWNDLWQTRGCVCVCLFNRFLRRFKFYAFIW